VDLGAHLQLVVGSYGLNHLRSFSNVVLTALLKLQSVYFKGIDHSTGLMSALEEIKLLWRSDRVACQLDRVGGISHPTQVAATNLQLAL